MGVCVLYRNPNGWTDRDEIWHGGGPRGGWFLGFLTRYPTPLGTGCIKGMRGASGASTMCFGENFIKQKLQGAPDLVGAGCLFGPQIRKDLGPMSPLWTPYPDLEGPGPGVLLEPWCLTFKESLLNQSCSVGSQ